jgi:hypothetical protein
MKRQEAIKRPDPDANASRAGFICAVENQRRFDFILS